MAKSNGAGLKTEIKQKQVAIPITNVILAPYLEKSSREVEEDVLNELKENPLLEKKSDEAEPVVAVHKPETEYDNPYHALAQRQFGSTAGAMVCIDLESEEACFRCIDRLKLIHRATNLFDNRSLAIHPASTIFGLFTAEEKKSMDVLDTTIRLSIGLEDVDDLFDDLKQALS